MKTLHKSIAVFLMIFSLSAVAGWGKKPTQDIVDTAVAAGQFNTLVAAVKAADLVDTLKGEGPFTVFAPTDEAFAALPAGTVQALLNDIPQLTEILLYHVVPGKYKAWRLRLAGDVTTVQGQDLIVEKRHDGLYINDSKIVMRNIEASNGVIQVIDAVLIP